MKISPKALMLSCGIIIGSTLTVAFGIAQSGESEVIFACVDRHGELRIVDSEHCHHGETSLSWNRQGPPGPPGPAGPSGPPGAPGGSTNSLVSPNGEFIVSAEDDGITLTGAGSSIQLSASGINIISTSDLVLQSATNINVDAANTVLIEAGANLILRGPNVPVTP